MAGPTDQTSTANVLAAGDPSAIVGFIASVIVDPIDSQSFFVSVAQCPSLEWHEGLPLRADLDAALTIASPSLVVSVATTLFHGEPAPIEPVSSHTVNGEPFTPQTSARLLVSNLQEMACCADLRSTITTTHPNDRSGLAALRLFDCGQTSEPLSGQIECGWHEASGARGTTW